MSEEIKIYWKNIEGAEDKFHGRLKRTSVCDEENDYMSSVNDDFELIIHADNSVYIEDRDETRWMAIDSELMKYLLKKLNEFIEI